MFSFGGMDNEGKANNEMRVFKTHLSELRWIKLKCNGNPPIERYMHSMVYI